MDIGFYRYSFLYRGGDRVVVDYANYLAEQGHRVTFHTCTMKTIFSVHPAIRIHLLPVHNEIGFLLFPLCTTLHHDLLLFDIIHCAPFLGLRHRKNMVYFAQANDVEYYGNTLVRALIDRLYHWFFKRKTSTITVSDALTATFAAHYNAVNCHTVTNGINLQTFYPEPDPELLREKGGRKAIFFMARGDHYPKGFDIAMEVFRRLADCIPEKIALWLCGDHLPDLSLPFPVRQFGILEDSRLRQILSSADIFFYPSRHEGFGLFPLEALACGCAVVSTTAIPYAAQSRGMVAVPVDDIQALKAAIASIVGSQEKLVHLKEGALRTAQHYDAKLSQRLFMQVLTDIRSIVEGAREVRQH